MSGCIAMVARDRLYSHMERCKFVPKTIPENKHLLNVMILLQIFYRNRILYFLESLRYI